MLEKMKKRIEKDLRLLQKEAMRMKQKTRKKASKKFDKIIMEMLDFQRIVKDL